MAYRKIPDPATGAGSPTPKPKGLGRAAAESADQFYGARLARITDSHNNQWSISTHIEDLPPDQIAERL